MWFVIYFITLYCTVLNVFVLLYNCYFSSSKGDWSEYRRRVLTLKPKKYIWKCISALELNNKFSPLFDAFCCFIFKFYILRYRNRTNIKNRCKNNLVWCHKTIVMFRSWLVQLQQKTIGSARVSNIPQDKWETVTVCQCFVKVIYKSLF